LTRFQEKNGVVRSFSLQEHFVSSTIVQFNFNSHGKC
jgi:hypothetical protein